MSKEKTVGEAGKVLAIAPSESERQSTGLVTLAKAALMLSRAARPLSNFAYNVGQHRPDWDRTAADVRAFDTADNALHSLSAIEALKNPPPTTQSTENLAAPSGDGVEGCFHSMMVAGCLGCWQGHAARLQDHIDRLEASMALPIKERVESIIVEAVTNWHQSWSRVPLDTKDWIRNAAHSLSWDINRALPMSDLSLVVDKNSGEDQQSAPTVGSEADFPLCPVHQRLEDADKLEVPVGALNCIACSLNERSELLSILAPCAPQDNTKDSTSVLRDVVEFYQTHHGDNRVVVSYPATERCGHFKPSALGVPAPEDQCVKPFGHEGKHSLPIIQDGASASALSTTVPDDESSFQPEIIDPVPAVKPGLTIADIVWLVKARIDHLADVGISEANWHELESLPAEIEAAPGSGTDQPQKAERVGTSEEIKRPKPKKGYSIWIENGVWYTAPIVDSAKFGGHAYDNGGYEKGIRDCPCGSFMLDSSSGSKTCDPFGACPENPLPTTQDGSGLLAQYVPDHSQASDPKLGSVDTQHSPADEPRCTCHAADYMQHATYCPREGMDTDQPQSEVCIKCGDDKFWSRLDGTCHANVGARATVPRYCGCKCEFSPSPIPQRGEGLQNQICDAVRIAVGQCETCVKCGHRRTCSDNLEGKCKCINVIEDIGSSVCNCKCGFIPFPVPQEGEGLLPASEMIDRELVRLALEIYARASMYPDSRALHDRSNECHDELLKRLTRTPTSDYSAGLKAGLIKAAQLCDQRAVESERIAKLRYKKKVESYALAVGRQQEAEELAELIRTEAGLVDEGKETK